MHDSTPCSLLTPSDAECPKGLGAAGWLVALALVGGLAVSAGVRFVRGADADFFHFYEAGLAVRSGTDLYQSGSGGYIYPPLPAILFAPLTLLDRPTSILVWTVMNAAMILGAGWILARETTRRFGLTPAWGVGWVLALGLLVGADKISSLLKQGQTDAATFLLLAVALWRQRTHPTQTGLALGLAFNIKYQAVVFLHTSSCAGDSRRRPRCSRAPSRACWRGA